MSLIYIIKFLFIYLLSYSIKNVCSSLNEPSTFDRTKLKIITLNNDGSYSVNDKTKFINKTNSDYTYIEYFYFFKNWAKCVKVMYGDDVVWSHDPHNDKGFPTKLTLYYYLNGLGLYLNSTSYYYELVDGRWILLNNFDYSFDLPTPLLYKKVDPLNVESPLISDSQLDYVLGFGVLFLLMSLVMSTGLTVNYFKSKGLNKLKSTSVTVL